MDGIWTFPGGLSQADFLRRTFRVVDVLHYVCTLAALLAYLECGREVDVPQRAATRRGVNEGAWGGRSTVYCGYLRIVSTIGVLLR